jgi:hypothetical protein
MTWPTEVLDCREGSGRFNREYGDGAWLMLLSGSFRGIECNGSFIRNDELYFVPRGK